MLPQGSIPELLQNLSTSRDLAERLAVIEGRWRPGQSNRPSLVSLCTQINFNRIAALGKFWDPQHPGRAFNDLLQRTQLVLSSLAASGANLFYLLVGREKQLHIYLGTWPEISTDALLRSQYPGILLEPGHITETLQAIDRLPYCNALVGIPSVSSKEDDAEIGEQIDRLIRGLLPSCSWAFLVMGQPINRQHSEDLIDLLGGTIEQSRLEFQQPNTIQSLNRIGQHYIELLEIEFQRALRGRFSGNWMAQAYIISDSPDAAQIAASVFTGHENTPEPIQVIPCTDTANWAWSIDQTNWLNSTELTRLVQLPMLEYPEFPLQTVARFDVALPRETEPGEINLGWIQDIQLPTGQAFSIDRNALLGHTMIAGTTNSGKTNTCFHLLSELKNQKIPFLIIEPTKGEYRFLKASFPDLSLFTMGSPEAPIQINPFYVPPGVPIQTHLDYLQSLFAASFVLYSPMPYVLEAALHGVYQDKGWDFITSQCLRDTTPHLRAYPTLSDLYYKIEEVTNQLGYDERITLDVKAALRARINSLRIGNKGAMLDTREPFDFVKLLEGQAVIEMASIGDDEQKAFLIGLLLIRLYEHYLAQGVQVGKAQIKHITVIEEAHRLLQNVNQSQGGDFANPRGKAVETFSNVITEIRGYGEGFVIVEQSPVKLTPDILKNTNLKLIHRIISGDDREALSQTMNLDDIQQEALVSLPKGRAVLFSAGMDHAMLVRFVESKERLTKGENTVQNGVSTPTPSDRAAGMMAQANDPGLQIEFSRWLVSSIFSDSEEIAAQACANVLTLFRSTTPTALRDQSAEDTLINSLIPSLSDWFTSRLGHFYNWPFKQEEQFIQSVNDLWHGSIKNASLLQLMTAGTKIEILPFEGCQYCAQPCLYRLLSEVIVNDHSVQEEASRLLTSYMENPTEEQISALALYMRYLSKRAVHPEVKITSGISLCIAVQLIYLQGYHGPTSKQLVHALQCSLNVGTMTPQ
jgi:hypothetical protein